MTSKDNQATDFFESISRCTWDITDHCTTSKTKITPVVATTTSDIIPKDTDLFERRGVSLTILRSLATASQRWPDLQRVLLKSGATAIVLEKLSKTKFSIEIRTLDENNVLQREYKSIHKKLILKNIPATVGERVFVRKLDKINCTRNANKKSAKTIIKYFKKNCFGKEGWGVPDRERLILATVLGYDSKKPLLFEHGNMLDDKPSVDLNHTLMYLPKPLKISKGQLFDVVVLDRRVTTKDICEEFIKPMTRNSETSMVDMMVANPKLISHVGPAEAFISHAWKYNFADVVDSLDLWFETTRLERIQKNNTLSKNPNETYLWFDIATVAQHASAQSKFPPNYFFNQFKEGIEAIGCTVLVLKPWYDPIPLQRSWCVWEIYCTIQGGILFETALSREDQHTRDHKSIVIKMDIKVENAQAWSPDDQTKIMKACESLEGGCNHVNNCIAEAFALDQVRHSIVSYDKPNSQHNFIAISGIDLLQMSVNYLVDYFKTPTKNQIDTGDNEEKQCEETKVVENTTRTEDNPIYRKDISNINLSMVTMSIKSFKSIAMSLSYLPNLTSLTLMLNEDSPLTDDCFLALAKSLELCKLLEKLYFVFKFTTTCLEDTQSNIFPGIVECLKSLVNIETSFSFSNNHWNFQDKESNLCDMLSSDMLSSTNVIEILIDAMKKKDSKCKTISIGTTGVVNEEICNEMTMIAKEMNWTFSWTENGMNFKNLNQDEKYDSDDSVDHL